MAKSMLAYVVGDLNEKRVYRQMMKRVKALPQDYRYTFKKIQQYLYNVDTADCELTLYTQLLELFEVSALNHKAVIDVVGHDVASFCDELIKASSKRQLTQHEVLNQEIAEYFRMERK